MGHPHYAGRLEFEAESGLEFAAALRGDGEGAAVEFAGEPLLFERESEERGTERASEVGAALGPVETTEGETAALGAGFVEVDTESGEFAGAVSREVVGVGRMRDAEPACGNEAVVQGDGDGPGEVVVATAGGAHVDGGGGREALAGAAGEDAEAFEGAGDGGRGEGVVAVASLHEDADEIVVFEAGEVHAGGRRGHAGDDGQLSAGARVAFHEAVEHARARRLADGGGDAGDCGVDGGFHRFTVDEVLVWSKRDY